MRRAIQAVAVSCLLAAGLVAVSARYEVCDHGTIPTRASGWRRGGRQRNINVPLSMAAKLLPTIDHGDWPTEA